MKEHLLVYYFLVVPPTSGSRDTPLRRFISSFSQPVKYYCQFVPPLVRPHFAPPFAVIMSRPSYRRVRIASLPFSIFVFVHLHQSDCMSNTEAPMRFSTTNVDTEAPQIGTKNERLRVLATVARLRLELRHVAWKSQLTMHWPCRLLCQKASVTSLPIRMLCCCWRYLFWICDADLPPLKSLPALSFCL